MTEQLVADMNKALSRISGLYHQWCQTHELNEYFIRILCALYHEPELTQKELSDKYLVPRQTVNNAVQFLKRTGCIELTQDADDKRWKRISFTEAGLRFAREELRPVLALDDYAAARLGPSYFAELTRLLHAYGDVIEQGMKELPAEKEGRPCR